MGCENKNDKGSCHIMLQKKVTQQVSLSSTRAFDVHVSMGAKSAYPLIVVIGEIFKSGETILVAVAPVAP